MTLEHRPILLRHPKVSSSSIAEATQWTASTSSSVPKTTSSWDLKVPNFIHQVYYQATDPILALPAILAGPLSPLAEVTMARSLLARGGATWLSRGLSLKYLPIFAGLGAETAGFGLGSRALTHFIQGPVPWDPASVAMDLALTGMTLTVLKGAGFAGRKAAFGVRGLNDLPAQLWTKADHRAISLASQVSGYLGLVGSQGLQAKLFPQIHHGSGNIWADALATHLALGIGTFAGRAGLGNRFQSFEQQINDQLHRVYQQTKPQWDFLESSRMVEATGIAQDGNYFSVGKEAPAGQGSSANKDDSGFLGKAKDQFENGTPFKVSVGMGPLLNGMPILRVPEEQVRAVDTIGQLTAEEAIGRFIENHLARMKRSRDKLQPFMVYYGGTKQASGDTLKEKIQKMVGSQLEESFEFAVGMPNMPSPMAYLFRKSSGSLERRRVSPIEQIKKRPSPQPSPRFAPPSTTLKAPAHQDRPPLEEQNKRPGERESEFVSRNRYVSAVSDVGETFRQILQWTATQKKVLAPASWFIEITQPFIKLNPDEMEEISQANKIDLTKHLNRIAIQEQIFAQMQSTLMEKISDAWREIPIPSGQVINIKWNEPLPATIKISEESNELRVSVSGVNIPLRNINIRRSDFQKGASVQLSRTTTVSPSSVPPPLGETTTRSEQPNNMEAIPEDISALELLNLMNRSGRLEKVKFDANSPAAALKKLGSLLDHQNSQLLPPRPIHITVAGEIPNSDFLSDLVVALKDHPLQVDQTVNFIWDTNEGEIKAEKDKGGEIHAMLSTIRAGGLWTEKVTLQADGKKVLDNQFFPGHPEDLKKK